MLLKKEWIGSLFSKNKIFNIDYDNVDDLKYGIINLCNLLKQDIFLIKVFSKDPLNEHFKNDCKKILNIQSFNIYLMDNVEILKQIDFSKIRLLNIYSTKNKFMNRNLNEMIKYCPFSVGLDNYLEYTKTSINLTEYDNITISQLPIR